LPPKLNYHGVLPVYKPGGMISKDVSRFLVRKIGKLHLGHVGTLDPMAEGVLPILIGRATRLQDQLLDMPKIYEFEVTFGIETDTLDTDGAVVKTLPWDHIDAEKLEAAARKFLGHIKQIPPAYSAVKYQGKPLYEYARRNELANIPLATMLRHVEIKSFDLQHYSVGKGQFRVECSKGTYIRVLAHDLAEAVGTCGTVSKIVRVKSAGIELRDCLTLQEIEINAGDFPKLLIPFSRLSLPMQNWYASEPVWAKRLKMGQKLLVRGEHFQQGLRDSAAAMQDSCALFLLDGEGDAFGLGHAVIHEGGFVQVTMTRGLQ